MSQKSPSRVSWTRGRIAAVALAALLFASVVVVAIMISVMTDSGASGGGTPEPETPTSLDGTGATGTPGAIGEGVPVPVPTGSSGDPDEDASDGVTGTVTVTVTELTAVEGEPRGAGELAGPAVLVLITIVNPTDSVIDTSSAVVNFYYGADNTPAVPVSGPGAYAFPSEIAARDTVEGAYAFTVPVDERESVTIVVQYAPDVEPVAIQGAAPR